MILRFADTSYFIAMLNVDDELHDAANRENARFRGTMVTTQWVLTELMDGFSSASTRARVARFVLLLESQANITIVPVTEEWFDKGINLYTARADKDWSLTDCISFEVMRERGISEALTADHHFEQAGFIALLT